MRPINLTEPAAENVRFYQLSQWPIWNLAFRPAFLDAGLLAVFSIGYWLLILTGYANWQLSMPATLWHAHEMMFGFAGFVAVGFLLTAAQTWTGVPSISGSALVGLTFVWLAARGAFFISMPSVHGINLFLVIGLQLLWWLGAIAALANMLIVAKSKNNYIFLFMLSALAALNISYLWLVIQQKNALALSIADTAILVMTILVGIIAGRVVPFFTARGLELSEQVRSARVDKILLYSAVLGVSAFFISQMFVRSLNPGWIMSVVAALHLTRSFIWWNSKVLTVPLLWSLHVSYFALGVGLTLVALSFFSSIILFSDALHMITIGTISMMILAMMSRVSLGHTGRPLRVPHAISAAFGLMVIAAITRSLLPIVIGSSIAWQLSALCWLVAFLLFLLHYAPILTQRRVDGRRG